MTCWKLRDTLNDNKPLFFDVTGGCGIDTSLGKSNCMDSVGIWFKHCPFCGQEIHSRYNNEKMRWEWQEGVWPGKEGK